MHPGRIIWKPSDARQYIGSALVSAIKGEATGVDALATAYKNCGGR